MHSGTTRRSRPTCSARPPSTHLAIPCADCFVCLLAQLVMLAAADCGPDCCPRVHVYIWAPNPRSSFGRACAIGAAEAQPCARWIVLRLAGSRCAPTACWSSPSTSTPCGRSPPPPPPSSRWADFAGSDSALPPFLSVSRAWAVGCASLAAVCVCLARMKLPLLHLRVLAARGVRICKLVLTARNHMGLIWSDFVMCVVCCPPQCDEIYSAVLSRATPPDALELLAMCRIAQVCPCLCPFFC